MFVLLIPYHCRAACNEFGAGSGLYRSRRLTSVVHDVAETETEIIRRNANRLTGLMQTEARCTVNALLRLRIGCVFSSCAASWYEELSLPSGTMD